MESIAASLDNYRIIPGIREVPLSEFVSLKPHDIFYSADDIRRSRDLAKGIAQNGWINPLIVVWDGDDQGPYILEGIHRAVALNLLGYTHLPALVVEDLDVSGSVNARDSKGRLIPQKYLAGLSPAERKQRIKELGESRDEYGTGDYSELPTDRIARKKGLVKLSAYRQVAQQRGFDISQVDDLEDMARTALEYYGVKPTDRQVSDLTQGLQKVYNKGLAAWKSGGHRPGATAKNWGDARVASVLVGGKAAWTADRKQFNLLPAAVRANIVKKLSSVYKALSSQGRDKDVVSIKAKAKQGMS